MGHAQFRFRSPLSVIWHHTIGQVTRSRQQPCPLCGAESQRLFVWMEGTRRDAMDLCPTCAVGSSIAMPGRLYDVVPIGQGWRAVGERPADEPGDPR